MFLGQFGSHFVVLIKHRKLRRTATLDTRFEAVQLTPMSACWTERRVPEHLREDSYEANCSSIAGGLSAAGYAKVNMREEVTSRTRACSLKRKLHPLVVYPGCSFCQFSMLCSFSAASRRMTVRPCSFKRKTVPVDGLSRRWMTPVIVASGVGFEGFEIPTTSYSGSRAGALALFAETNSRALEPSASTLAGCRYSGSLFSTGCL